jgi:hypothetical protein
VEIAGLPELTLQDGKIIPYNGNGASYTPIGTYLVLSQSIKRLWYIISSYSRTSNGSPDGLALVDASNKVIQFLSYEGVFKATTSYWDDNRYWYSTSTETVGTHFNGRGTKYSDFTWTAAVSTFGTLTKDKNLEI